MLVLQSTIYKIGELFPQRVFLNEKHYRHHAIHPEVGNQLQFARSLEGHFYRV